MLAERNMQRVALSRVTESAVPAQAFSQTDEAARQTRRARLARAQQGVSRSSGRGGLATVLHADRFQRILDLSRPLADVRLAVMCWTDASDIDQRVFSP